MIHDTRCIHVAITVLRRPPPSSQTTTAVGGIDLQQAEKTGFLGRADRVTRVESRTSDSQLIYLNLNIYIYDICKS